MTLIWTPEQDRILCEIDAWLNDPFQPNWKYLAGVAGSGKSSMAQAIAQNRAVKFCAYTGKAASVMREKGCEGATTIHRMIYRPQEKPVRAADGTEYWSTEFVARDDDPLADVELVILDECSMCNAAQAQDLLSYGKRILVLGDPFQLPPVEGNGFFVSKKPDWFLTEVHRQALDSGILRLATDIRSGRGIQDPESYGPEAVVCSLDEAQERETEIMQWADVVIVGTHRMRRHFNKQYRDARKAVSMYPERDDQLVCLQNNHRLGLLNGAIWTCEADAQQYGYMGLEMLVSSEDDPSVKLLAECWSHDFTGDEDKLKQMSWQRRSERARFDYGYALTCHKAQGSQFDRVLLIDESRIFREHAANWAYTATTRAAKQLIMVQR